VFESEMKVWPITVKAMDARGVLLEDLRAIQVLMLSASWVAEGMPVVEAVELACVLVFPVPAARRPALRSGPRHARAHG
jgi:hypothetical protein